MVDKNGDKLNFILKILFVIFVLFLLVLFIVLIVVVIRNNKDSIVEIGDLVFNIGDCFEIMELSVLLKVLYGWREFY